MTADELAKQVAENILSVRPQVTLLTKENKIEDTGECRRNESGRMAAVWRALPRSAWSDAPTALTAREKIKLLKDEVYRLRALCDRHDTDWRKDKLI